MRIVPYDPALAPLIEAFNARLREGGSEWEFPSGPVQRSTELIHVERYLCRDGEFIRGGYNLVTQSAWTGTALEPVGFVRLPLSEGIVNPKFPMVGAVMLKDAMKRSPLTFSLGMGGMDKPLPKLYRALGAKLRPVPFYFRVAKASRFLRNIGPLRTSRGRRVLLDLVAATRLADLPVRAYHAWKAMGAPASGLQSSVVPEFGEWADEIWSGALANYSFACGRRASELNLRLPPEDPRIHRLKVSAGERAIGWAAVTDNQWSSHPYFGSMRLGAFVDSLALPGFEAGVTAAATNYLLARGVDLIVTNQLHRDWIAAVERCGYRKFPSSNFVLATAPVLEKRFDVIDSGVERVHMNRGDGDGPINL